MARTPFNRETDERFRELEDGVSISGLSFTTIQPDAGTSPVADTSADTLTLSSSSAALTITGDSATDTVTWALDGDLTALAALSGTDNIYYRSGANTWTSVTIGTGLTFSGGTLSNSASGVTDHGALTGLSDDDHTQYTLLAGRSGGQTIIGGTAASNNLTLQSTSNATRGSILLSDVTRVGGSSNTTSALSVRQNSDSAAASGISMQSTDGTRSLHLNLQNNRDWYLSDGSTYYLNWSQTNSSLYSGNTGGRFAIEKNFADANTTTTSPTISAAAMGVVNTSATNGNFSGYYFKGNVASNNPAAGIISVNDAHGASASATLAFLTRNSGTYARRMNIASDGSITMDAYGAGFPQFSSVGLISSTKQVVRLLNINTTSVGNVGAGTDDLISYTLPAGTLAANGDTLEITCWGTYAANANNKTINVSIDAATEYTTGAIAAVGVSWQVKITYVRLTSTTQTMSITFISGFSALRAEAETSSGAATMANAIVFKLTAAGTADNDIVQTGMLVKYMGAT